MAVVTNSYSDEDDNTEHIEDEAADKFNYEVGVTTYCRSHTLMGFFLYNFLMTDFQGSRKDTKLIKRT